jgi:hypothetical protein
MVKQGRRDSTCTRGSTSTSSEIDVPYVVFGPLFSTGPAFGYCVMLAQKKPRHTDTVPLRIMTMESNVET